MKNNKGQNQSHQYQANEKTKPNELPDQAGPEKSDGKQFLPKCTFNLAILSSLLTGAAYITGVQFHQSYLERLKIPAGLIPKSSSEYFLYAYQAMVELMPAFLGSKAVALLAFIAIFCIALVGMNKLGQHLDARPQFRQMQEHLRNTKSLRLISEIILYPVLGVALAVYAALFLFILLLIPAVIGEAGAKSLAERDLSLFKLQCKQSPESGKYCITIRSADKPLATGIVVDMSDKYVAMYVNDEPKVFTLEDREFEQSKIEQEKK